MINPALDEALARLASRAAAGRLASLPWTEVGDRLRALGDVEVRYLDDGGAEVVNHGDVALGGLTVSLPAAGLELWVDGVPATPRQDLAATSRDLRSSPGPGAAGDPGHPPPRPGAVPAPVPPSSR